MIALMIAGGILLKIETEVPIESTSIGATHVDSASNDSASTHHIEDSSKRREGTAAPIVSSKIPKLPATKKEDVLSSSYLELHTSAQEGDSAAAYLLSTKLRFCSEVGPRMDLFARYVEEGTMEESDDRYHQVLKDWRQCSDVPEASYENRYAWLEKAAQLGDERALLDYVRFGSSLVEHPELAYRDPSALEQYKTNSLRFLNTAATRGSVEAMVELSGIYSDGYLTNKDDTLSYAYSYAASQAGEASNNILRLMEMQRAKLPAEEEARGRQIGETILYKCCR